MALGEGGANFVLGYDPRKATYAPVDGYGSVAVLVRQLSKQSSLLKKREYTTGKKSGSEVMN